MGREGEGVVEGGLGGGKRSGTAVIWVGGCGRRKGAVGGRRGQEVDTKVVREGKARRKESEIVFFPG